MADSKIGDTPKPLDNSWTSISLRSNKKPRSECTTDDNFSNIYLLEWASITTSLAFSILDKLLEPIDHVRFAFVCKKWRYVAKEYNHTTQRWRNKHLLPLILVPRTILEGRGRDSVYSFSEGTIYSNTSIKLPLPYYKICGCSLGWLATIEDEADKHVTIALQNPFTSTEDSSVIRLPRFDLKHVSRLHCRNDEVYYVKSVIFSAEPSLNAANYAVFAICNTDGRLIFTRAGQDDWICTGIRSVAVVVFYKNQVYAVQSIGGGIVSIDINSNIIRRPKLNVQSNARSFGNISCSYLVESTKGNILHVRRHGQISLISSIKFMVSKWVFNEKDSSIDEIAVQSLGDESLFLDHNVSVAVLASSFPWCKPNSIYYTRYHRIYVFNMEDATSTQIDITVGNLRRTSPILIVPQLNGL